MKKYKNKKIQIVKINFNLYENYIELLLMNDNDFDFLLLFFEIFSRLKEKIMIIYRRKYKLLNNFEIDLIYMKII